MKRLVERAAVLRRVRSFFEDRDFLEVQTPVLVPSPGLDVHLDAFEVAVPGGPPRYLSTSPEYQMKRLLADGHARIFQIAPAFRRAEIGSRHNPEFTILEWYRAHAGVDEVMRDTEELVEAITGGEVQLEGRRRLQTRAPFERITLADAYQRWAGVDVEETLRLARDDEETFYRLLVDRVEPGLAALDHGVLLTDYPISQASLARARPGDPRFAERFEAYVAGVELCNGFGELVDAVEQRTRLERDQATRAARGLPVYPIDERFLSAVARLPPCAGNAVGLDRLVALSCGTTEIAGVMSFVDDEL